MFTMVAQSTRKAVSAAAAIAIVSFGGLVLDQAHVAAAPRGTVEVGELTLIDEAQAARVTLPEGVGVAKRESANTFAAMTQLPEIVVVAKRVAYLAAKDSKRQLSPAINAGVEGALLK
ncbi:MAG: hypothetical protein ACRES3_11080 [Steroidobacteraceae bacterium]